MIPGEWGGLVRRRPELVRWDELMLRIPNEVLFGFATLLGSFQEKLDVAAGSPDMKKPLPADKAAEFLAVFEKVAAHPRFTLWLPYTTDTVNRLRTALADPTTPIWRIAVLLRDFGQRMEDEMGKHIYLQVDDRVKGAIQNPLAGWEPVIAKFSQLTGEITEASLTYAFERPTACVFHVMRIMEFALDRMRVIAKVRTKKATWDGMLRDIDKKLKPKPGARTKKTKRQREQERFLADAAMLLRATKDAWRNPTMHSIDKVYTMQQAGEVYSAVRSFMIKIAEAT